MIKILIGRPETVGQLKEKLSFVTDYTPLMVINAPLPLINLVIDHGQAYVEFDCSIEEGKAVVG